VPLLVVVVDVLIRVEGEDIRFVAEDSMHGA